MDAADVLNFLGLQQELAKELVRDGKSISAVARTFDRFEALTGLLLRTCPHYHVGTMVVID